MSFHRQVALIFWQVRKFLVYNTLTYKRAKGRVSGRERPCFGAQKTAFCSPGSRLRPTLGICSVF